jgi:hypothetical protein
MPALAALTKRENARWCTWVAPPYQPFAPALAAQGMALEQTLIVRTAQPLWAFEQALRSGACEGVLAWMRRLKTSDIRRLQLAAERGRTLGILFRGHRAALEASSAMLRVRLEPDAAGARVTLLKSRGGSRQTIRISWNEAHDFGKS